MYQKGEDVSFNASVDFGNWATGDFKQRGMNGKKSKLDRLNEWQRRKEINLGWEKGNS